VLLASCEEPVVIVTADRGTYLNAINLRQLCADNTCTDSDRPSTVFDGNADEPQTKEIAIFFHEPPDPFHIELKWGLESGASCVTPVLPLNLEGEECPVRLTVVFDANGLQRTDCPDKHCGTDDCPSVCETVTCP